MMHEDSVKEIYNLRYLRDAFAKIKVVHDDE